MRRLSFSINNYNSLAQPVAITTTLSSFVRFISLKHANYYTETGDEGPKTTTDKKNKETRYEYVGPSSSKNYSNNENQQFRDKKFYFDRAASHNKTSLKTQQEPYPLPNTADIGRREYHQQQQFDSILRGTGNNNNNKGSFLPPSSTPGMNRFKSKSTRVPFKISTSRADQKKQKNRFIGEDFDNIPEVEGGTDNDQGPSLTTIAKQVGGTEAQFISRKKREGEYVQKLNQQVDDMWYNSKGHLVSQDRLVNKLGSVEAAVRETLQPSTTSLREEIRRRPLDKSILEEIYREQHGKRSERLLRKGFNYERWIARSEDNQPILDGSERSRAMFGFGGNIELISEARFASDFPQTSAPEVAFIGGTNSGRSSLLNSVFNSFVCKYAILPGTTTTANFYSISNGRMNIVDLPGYGYYHPIQAPKGAATAAVSVLKQYLNEASPVASTHPRNVKRIFLCVGSLALTRNDLAYLEFMERNRIPFGVILTKTDITGVKSLARKADFIRGQLMAFTMCQELMMASALRLSGISKLQNQLSQLSASTEKSRGLVGSMKDTNKKKNVVYDEDGNRIQNAEDDDVEEDELKLDMSAIV